MGLVAQHFLVLLALLASGCAVAQPHACKVIDPELQGTYTGGCKDGIAEGYGEARGMAEYRGELRAGRPHGKGVKTWPQGDRYEGSFVDGRKEGTGMYTWGRGSSWAGQRYTGGYANDRRQGYGVYEYPNGDRYAGPWENDRFVGPPTRAMIARGRIYAERAAEVGRVRTRVCRVFEVGIGVRDIVRGTVTGVDGARITVRIEDPGKLDNKIEGRVIAKGELVVDELLSWVPCL